MFLSRGSDNEPQQGIKLVITKLQVHQKQIFVASCASLIALPDSKHTQHLDTALFSSRPGFAFPAAAVSFRSAPKHCLQL